MIRADPYALVAEGAAANSRAIMLDVENFPLLAGGRARTLSHKFGVAGPGRQCHGAGLQEAAVGMGRSVELVDPVLLTPVAWSFP